MSISSWCEDCEREDCDGCMEYERWREDGMKSDYEDEECDED